jgi:predicted DNA-binding transcriptional regulator AlpA
MTVETTPDINPERVDPFLDDKAVGELLLLPPKKVARFAREGKLPPPDLRLNARLRRWRRSTIERWLKERQHQATA